MDKEKSVKEQYTEFWEDLPPIDRFDIKKEQFAAQIAALNTFTNNRYPNLKGLDITEKTTLKEVSDIVYKLGYDLNLQFRRPYEESVKPPFHNKIPINTKIKFICTITNMADGDRPALLYANPNDTGKIVRHNEFEGYMVSVDGSERYTSDNVPVIIGAYEYEFIVI